MIWASQGYELLYSFRNLEGFCKIVPHLLNRVVDRPLRFNFVTHFNKSWKQVLSKVYSRMGFAYFFSYWSPNGHYILNLSNKVERDVAVSLVVQNKQAIKRISAGERVDRSQFGNKSCFRNERFNGQSFLITTEDWALPQTGVLEFDFVNLIDRPTAEDVLP